MSEPERSEQRKIATTRHPTILAVTKSLFRFHTLEDALAKLKKIDSYFETSSKLPIKQQDGEVCLWIKGYKVSRNEKEVGYLGNFARLSVVTAEGRWTIQAQKLEVGLQFHPQRRRPKARHPDWGHPILKEIKRQRVYPNVAVAENELRRLHEAYPETSIPTGPELFLMIYEKGATPPVQKYVLGIAPQEEGGVTIVPRLNMPESEETPEIEGPFAARAAMEQSRKRSKKTYLQSKKQLSDE